MIYRTICTQLWTDPKVQHLSVQGKCLFLYLITNPQTHLSGIYSLSLPLVHEQTGLSYTLCHTLLDTLSRLDLAVFDASTKVVWVKKMFAYQGRGPKNEIACARHLATLHHSCLIAQFLDAYPSVKSYVSPTVSYTLSDTPSTFGPSVPDPDSDPDSVSAPEGKECEKGANGRDYRTEARELLGFLNEKAKKRFRESEINLGFIIARLKSGVDVQTCKSLIARKVRDWKSDETMARYLRPETLFNATKFESYLAEVSG